jgi:hypothetical protein
LAVVEDNCGIDWLTGVENECANGPPVKLNIFVGVCDEGLAKCGENEFTVELLAERLIGDGDAIAGNGEVARFLSCSSLI